MSNNPEIFEKLRMLADEDDAKLEEFCTKLIASGLKVELESY